MRIRRRSPALYMFVWIVLLPGCAGRLAELDDLERRLDEVGTITVKEPDVWGEARLTKHRQEFEEHLGKRVGTFKEVISARIRRSDAASLTGSGAVAVGEIFAPGEPKPVVDRPDVTLKGLSPAVPPVTPPRDEGKTPGPGLEPNEGLRQEQSYIGVNQALRRINAGDDVGQLPGYAVYLLRFPISVMPGSRTRAGYRAQVTLSVRPDVAQINYLLWETSQPFLAAFVEAIVDGLYRERAEKARMLVKRGPTPPEKETKRALRDLFGADGYRLSFSVQKPPFGPGPQEGRFRLALAGVAKELIEADVDRGRIESVIEGLLVKNREALARAAADALIEGQTKDPKAFRAMPDQPYRPLELSFLEGNRLSTISIDSSRVANLATRFPARQEELKDKDKRSALSSQITSEIGKLLSEPTVMEAAKEQYVKIISDREAQVRAISGGRFDPDAFREVLYVEFHPDHMVEVSVLGVSYPFRLSHAGDEEQVNELRRALVSGEVERVRSLVAQAVHRQYTKKEEKEEKERSERKDPLPLLTSAWMKRIGPRVNKYLDRRLHEPLVEGLNDDDKKWFTRTCLQDEDLKARIRCVYEQFNPFDFSKKGYGFPQDPPSSGTFQFLVEILMRSLYEYETPIRAFALDPVLEEQNAVDLFSRRRDLQLAMALAVGSGKITGKAAGDFIRRFELDMDVIALNRTITAFNVGQATFGWVFSPRIQTPPDESLLGWFNPVKLWTSERTRDRESLELEPGTREVHAIVAVPAYFQEAEITATVNWIPMNDPGEHLFSFTEAKDRHKEAVEAEKRWYQPTDRPVQDWGLMTGRLIALQHKTPLQRLVVRLPYDHTSSIIAAIQDEGQASLAPVVADVVPDQGPEDRHTDVFISGKSFDINSTRVIVGGQEVPGDDVKLMSRRLVKARLPKSPATPSPVQLYVATPWGRSNGYPFTYLTAKAAPPQPVTGTLQTKTLEVVAPEKVDPAEIVIRLSGAKRGASTTPAKSKIAIVDSKGGVILLGATYQATVVDETKVDQVVSTPGTDSDFAKKLASLAAGQVSSIKTYLLVNGVQEEIPVAGTLILVKR